MSPKKKKKKTKKKKKKKTKKKQKQLSGFRGPHKQKKNRSL